RVRRRGRERGPDVPRRPDAVRRREGLRQHEGRPGVGRSRDDRGAPRRPTALAARVLRKENGCNRVEDGVVSPLGRRRIRPASPFYGFITRVPALLRGDSPRVWTREPCRYSTACISTHERSIARSRTSSTPTSTPPHSSSTDVTCWPRAR